MSVSLAEQHCRPLGRETAPLEGPALERLMGALDPEWRIHNGPLLVRQFASKEYPRLVSLTARIGALAQEQDHHPDLKLSFGKLEVALSTHSVGGLSQNDFVLAARIDRLATESSF